MTLGRFSAHKITSWMDDMEETDKWMTIVSSDPLATNSPYTAEASGGTLTRVLGSWTRTGPGLLTLDSAISFVGLPEGSHVAGVAGFDAAVNGNLLFSDLLEVPVDFPFGGTYTLAAGQYVIGIDVPGA